MKKFNLFIHASLFLIALNVYAQDETNLMPQPKEFGFQLTALGIGPLVEDNWAEVFTNNELHLKYVVSEKRYYTLGFFINTLSGNSEEMDSVRLPIRNGVLTVTSKESQLRFVIIPGIEHHFVGTRRIDPYISLRLPIGYIGKFKSEAESIENSIQTNGDIYQRTSTEKFSIAGGLSFGLRGALGVNYYIANRFALGIDYGISLEFERFGGDIEESMSTRIVDGTDISTTELADRRFDQESVFEISNKGVLGLNFVFFFGKSAEVE